MTDNATTMPTLSTADERRLVWRTVTPIVAFMILFAVGLALHNLPLVGLGIAGEVLALAWSGRLVCAAGFSFPGSRWSAQRFGYYAMCLVGIAFLAVTMHARWVARR